MGISGIYPDCSLYRNYRFQEFVILKIKLHRYRVNSYRFVIKKKNNFNGEVYFPSGKIASYNLKNKQLTKLFLCIEITIHFMLSQQKINNDIKKKIEKLVRYFPKTFPYVLISKYNTC